MQATTITQTVAFEQTRDRLRSASAARGAHRSEAGQTTAGTEDVVIRLARPNDERALRRLSELDGNGRTSPEQPVLVAESGGSLAAALSLTAGRSVADPFRPTASLVALLEARAAQIAAADSGTRHGTRALARLLPRTH